MKKWPKLERYSRGEAWAYDTVISPAVTLFGASLFESIAPQLPTAARVLDVGCGGGQIALALAARREDLKITGIDLSPAQVARALKRAQSRRLAVTFQEGDALRLPFPDGAFDLVYSVASLKHWPDERQGLEECRRVLTPGGTLIILEADRGCRIDDAYAFVSAWRIPRLLRVFALLYFRTFVAGQSLDLDEARAFLAQLGLQDVAVERTSGLPGLKMSGRKPLV